METFPSALLCTQLRKAAQVIRVVFPALCPYGCSSCISDAPFGGAWFEHPFDTLQKIRHKSQLQMPPWGGLFFQVPKGADGMEHRG